MEKRASCKRKARIVDSSTIRALDLTLWNENADKLNEDHVHKVVAIVGGLHVCMDIFDNALSPGALQ